MLNETESVVVQALQANVAQWLNTAGAARNTVAGAIVTVDMLRIRAPFTETDLVSPAGQLVGGRGASLKKTLQRYGVQPDLLVDGVTTRAIFKFVRLAQAIDWGTPLQGWHQESRAEAVHILVAPLLEAAATHTTPSHPKPKHLTLHLDRQLSPLAWVEEMLAAARERSQGRVEQHLIWSKLKTLYPDRVEAEHAAFAGDVQTGRAGDIVVGDIVFHVTAAPATPVIEKCVHNLQAGKHPVLVVPRLLLERAKTIAETCAPQVHRRITCLAIEDFLASNILELAGGDGRRFFDVLQQLVEQYNEVIMRTETDASLRIEVA